jgi:predicted O-methyltransferase YrrM
VRYAEAFKRERENVYPAVDAFEQASGFAIERERLEAAARVLACPVKKNPPNWQHGRVLYAAIRELLDRAGNGGVFLDIGTAKGFSAVVMAWAIADADAHCRVLSVDAIDPLHRVPRNSVWEADGSKFTVPEFVAEFIHPERHRIEFHGGGSLDLLDELHANGEHIRFAFVDGKHEGAMVATEAELIKSMQRPGDVVLFDDLQVPSIHQSVARLSGYWPAQHIRAHDNRAYALAVRR